MRLSRFAVTVADENNCERIVYPVAVNESAAREKVEKYINDKQLKMRILLVRRV